MSPSLAETERIFWEAISYPTGVQAYLEQADKQAVTVFNQAFITTPEFSREERMGVYAEAYFFRLLEVLADQFPMLVWLVGEQSFHNLVTDYLLVHPSSDPNLRRLGDHFPEFLESHPILSICPAAADFSRIELAIDQALDAADSAVLTQEQLAQVAPNDWPQMHFDLCPSVQLIGCAWDFRSFREAKQTNQPVPKLPASIVPFEICVWRKGFTVFTRTLGSGEAVFLRTISQGSTFGAAASASEAHGVDASQLVQLLARWLEEELLANVRT